VPTDAGEPEVRLHEVVIVGGGISGIGAAAMLHREGVEDFVVLERADDDGGTWYLNDYPGCACDIPSHLYQYGFRPNPEWSQIFAPRPEILAYLRDIAAEHDMARRTRLGTEMLDARWDEAAACWELTTNTGPVRARLLIVATGSLHEAMTAQIPGAASFRGRTFHSSRWPAGYDGAGERVAVIGTGASSIQITPMLQRTAGHVTVFQRTPSWIQPRPNWRHSEPTRRLVRRSKTVRRLLRAVMWSFGELMLLGSLKVWLGRILGLLPRLNLHLQVRDRELRRSLTPHYTMGCKRLLVSSEFYPALQQPNCELVDSPVAEIGERTVTAADGRTREVDTIVFATGFSFGLGVVAARIHGRDGTDLASVWDGSPEAYVGTTVAGFPNMALLWGPNSGTASLFVTIEAQLRYLAGMLHTMRAEGVRALDVRPDAQREFRARTERAGARSVVILGGCRTWYQDEKGHNQLTWPGTMVGMWRRLSRFDRDRYEAVVPAAEKVTG
jgi:cyclohexanone monooxygenase